MTTTRGRHVPRATRAMTMIVRAAGVRRTITN
jgi:hypothetical protein